jgi:hypothetical protein
VNDSVDKAEKTWNDRCENFHNEKLKEIEEAHNKWKAKQAEKMLDRIQKSNN